MARPKAATHQSEKPCEAVRPVAQVGQKPKENVNKQTHPHLPLDRVLAVAEEVAKLECLLDLFEEGFYRPSVFVQVGHGGGGPVEVVGQKGHLDGFAVDLDDGVHPAQPFGVVRARGGGAQHDFVVAQNRPRARWMRRLTQR